MSTAEKIKCPKCGAEIDVSTALRDKIKMQMQGEFSKQIKKEIEKEFSEKHDETIKSLNEELNKKSKELREFNKAKADLEKLKREKEEAESRITAAKEAEFTKKLKAERERIKKEAMEENALKFDELNKKLKDQTALAEEMKCKAEQGSVQLQGEVQELAIENILKDVFRFDVIEPVPKGMKGADVIQKVRNNAGNEVGIIAYESKRAKIFGKDWIGKLKEDGSRVKADVCVLVTDALPDDIERIGQKDGVWICTFIEFKWLALALRENLIQLNVANAAQTNKGDKMQMLYDYLTGKEFSAQIRTIIEGFSDLQKGYLDEKHKMEKIWKTREKQLEKILLNTNGFIGSIQGIAGSSLPEIPMIEEGNRSLEDG